MYGLHIISDEEVQRTFIVPGRVGDKLHKQVVLHESDEVFCRVLLTSTTVGAINVSCEPVYVR